MALLWVSSELHKIQGKETETHIHAGNSTIHDYSSLPLIQVTRLSEAWTDTAQLANNKYKVCGTQDLGKGIKTSVTTVTVLTEI